MSIPQDRGSASDRATPEPGRKYRDTPLLSLNAREKAFMAAAVEIEMTPAWEAGAVGYTSSLWAQFSLPYRDPGDVRRWERTNGLRTLFLRPALVTEGKQLVEGYPFGVFPRLILAHLATEAVRTRSRDINVGSSLNQFIDILDVGLGKNGRTNARIKKQAARLLGSEFLVKEKLGFDPRRKSRLDYDERFVLADNWSLWVPVTEDKSVPETADEGDTPRFTSDNRIVWPNTIRLTEQFYADLLDGGAVPIDLRALRALAPWPMAVDIYCWMTWRIFKVYRKGKPGKRITWAQLNGQFGSQFTRQRAFKDAFIDLLETKVRLLYPAAEYDIDQKEGLLLLPSPPHVPPVPPAAEDADDRPRPPQRTATRRPTGPAPERCPEHGLTHPCGSCRADRLARKD